MENNKLPAYPTLIYDRTTGQMCGQELGFTKLELASLMIAQGYASQEIHNEHNDEDVAKWSVSLAKAVLEETNKSTDFHDPVTENAKQCYEFAISVLEKIRDHFENYSGGSPEQGHIEDKIEELKSLIK